MLFGMRIIVGWSIRLLMIQHTAFTADALELSVGYSYITQIYAVEEYNPILLICHGPVCLAFLCMYG